MISEYSVEDMLEVETLDRDQFLKVKETLTRIGIPNAERNSLTQTCHVFHKQGRYYIVHFLEMYALDRQQCRMEPSDYIRRDTIASLLESWGMVKVVDRDLVVDKIQLQPYGLTVIPFAKKSAWLLKSNYNVGAI